MTGPAPLNAGEPVPVLAGGGVVTTIDGTTFCISQDSGDIDPGAAHGLFYRDTRIVSLWQLRIDGHAPQPLSVLDTHHLHAARFVLRRPPMPGHADSTMLVLRNRTVGEGMREVIVLCNVGREPTTVRLDLHVGTDFADLFAVKEGRAGAESFIAQAGVDLVFTRPDGSRGLLVHATGEPSTHPGMLTWDMVIPPRQERSVEVIAQPLVENRRVDTRFREAVPVDSHLAERTGARTRIQVGDPGLAAVLRRSARDLEALRIVDAADPDRTFVAAGAPWFMTLFGRDSLLTAWMMLPLDPSVAVGTLRTLAALQGRRVEPRTEEEPGRIPHELRVGPDSTTALGGTHYYGTIDASPLFVMLLGEAWRWGATEAEVRSLLPAADAALSWMDHYGDRDGDGFLEYQRATDRGLFNQGWKDSWDGVNDSAGHLAETPVALAEVQGYAYAAWLARAELAEAFGDPATALNCRERASTLRRTFAERFWLPEEGYFAIALDGHKRPVDSLTSNPGHCLWTGIVDDEHAEPLIRRLSGPDMDSGFGLRTLSEAMVAYSPMSYHNGSVWPHDTAICVAGLMRYAHVPGAIELAHRLAGGLLDAAATFGGRLPELYCGFPRETYNPPVPYPTSCSPQAWASAAPLLLLRSFMGLEPDVPRGRLVLRPALPAQWGKVVLDRLRLGDETVRITVGAENVVDVTGLSPEWSIDG